MAVARPVFQPTSQLVVLRSDEVRVPAVSGDASGAEGCADFVGEVAVVVTSPALLAGDVAVGVASLAIAGAASLADLATVDVTPSTVAGVVSMLGWRPRPTLLRLSL